MCEMLLPTFSSKSFLDSWVTFPSFVHFEFTLVYYGVSWWSRFTDLQAAVQFSQHHRLKEAVLTPRYVPAAFDQYPLSTKSRVNFRVLRSVLLVSIPVLVPWPGCVDYSGFLKDNLISGTVIPTYLVLLIQDCCGSSGSFFGSKWTCEVFVQVAWNMPRGCWWGSLWMGSLLWVIWAF